MEGALIQYTGQNTVSRTTPSYLMKFELASMKFLNSSSLLLSNWNPVYSGKINSRKFQWGWTERILLISIARHVEIQAESRGADHVLVDQSSAGVGRGHGGQPKHDGVGEMREYREHAGTGDTDGTSNWRLLCDVGRSVLWGTTLNVAELDPDSGLDTLEVAYELKLNGASEVQLW